MLFATLVNGEDFLDVEVFTQVNKEILKRYIELANGIPLHGHDTKNEG
jgi:hypothetical protein